MSVNCNKIKWQFKARTKKCDISFLSRSAFDSVDN